MNTLISILIVKMQVSTINYLKFLSTPTRWSVGRSNEQSVDRSVGRPVGHLNGRSVGQSVGRSVGQLNGQMVILTVCRLVNWTVG